MGLSNEIMIGSLIFVPFIVALILSFVGNNTVRKVIVYFSAVCIMFLSAAFAISFLINGKTISFMPETEIIDKIMLGGEFFLMGIIIWLSIKYKKLYAAALSIVQTVGLAWLELSGKTEHFKLDHIYCDRLTIVMVLMIGIIGSFICIYAIGYMTDYTHHHTDVKDRRKFFFGMLFVFLGAMFGLVFSSNLIWIYFFWEITSVSSFLLIGYTKTEEAIYNSFRALWMNLLGGVAFAGAIVFAVIKLDVINLSDLIICDNKMLLFPLMLLAVAGLTKSAQLPFSKWLMGAMVAPTPTSALLHSATMVKAGVYLLIRLAPAMQGNSVGYTVALIGGFTFFFSSVRAIVHSDGKKILAYSTVSNLGLITACAGVGAESTVWAAIFLMMFHAISKSLLFQSVGAIENTIGSRDIEDMHGIIRRYPFLAAIVIIGIFGMYLAPFGMLISKWAALKAFIDAGNIILVLFLAFGSATTMFYWTKWLLKIFAWSDKTETRKNQTSIEQCVSLVGHVVLMITLVILYALVSQKFVEPMISEFYGHPVGAVISYTDMIIMSCYVGVIVLIPLLAILATRHVKVTKTNAYMSGINRDKGRKFVDSFGKERDLYLSNWYMLDIMGSRRFLNISTVIAVAGLIIGIAFSIGGAF